MERNETQLANIKAKEAQGLASKLDLYSAESSYLSSQADYAESKDTVNYALMSLKPALRAGCQHCLNLKGCSLALPRVTRSM